jgi:L-cystine uptake protein TcyP (sodium:dicarboxylate symporter family)
MVILAEQPLFIDNNNDSPQRHWQILIAIMLAVLCGFIYKATKYSFFINALKMLIVPLITSTIISGISNIGNDGAFARLGLKPYCIIPSPALPQLLPDCCWST